MTSAHVLINCETGSKKEVLNELKKFETITEVREVYGAFDIIAKLVSPNIQELQENISTDLRKINNVISTMTLMNTND